MVMWEGRGDVDEGVNILLFFIIIIINNSK